MLQIVTLGSDSEYIDQIVLWLWKEWGSENNFRFFDSLVRHSLNRSDIPSTFAATYNGRLVGTASLWRADLMCRQDLYPWLAGLYVDRDFRNKGIGTMLQQHALETARKYGYNSLYLFTQLTGYYEKNGWNFIGEEVDRLGKTVRLYKKDL